MQSGCQIYVKGSAEAVAFYQEAFNLTLGMIDRREDGAYVHASLMAVNNSEKEILAVAEDSFDICNDRTVGNKCPVMAFNVWDIGTREMVDHIFAALSADARFNENPDGPAPPFWDENGYGFALVDKFGVHWGVMK